MVYDAPSLSFRPAGSFPGPFIPGFVTVRSTSEAEWLDASDFRLTASNAPTPLTTPPLAIPFCGEVMLCVRAVFFIARWSGSMEVSEMVDALLELAELPSKLSFDVCECGWRTTCPLTLVGDKPYSAARSRCTTPEDCESAAVFPPGTNEGISGRPAAKGIVIKNVRWTRRQKLRKGTVRDQARPATAANMLRRAGNNCGLLVTRGLVVGCGLRVGGKGGRSNRSAGVGGGVLSGCVV